MSVVLSTQSLVDVKRRTGLSMKSSFSECALFWRWAFLAWSEFATLLVEFTPAKFLLPSALHEKDSISTVLSPTFFIDGTCATTPQILDVGLCHVPDVHVVLDVLGIVLTQITLPSRVWRNKKFSLLSALNVDRVVRLQVFGRLALFVRFFVQGLTSVK